MYTEDFHILNNFQLHSASTEELIYNYSHCIAARIKQMINCSRNINPKTAFKNDTHPTTNTKSQLNKN